MNLMKTLFAAGAVAVMGSTAMASTMQYSYANVHGQGVTITASPVPVLGTTVEDPTTRNVWAGAFTMTNLADAADQFLAFCLDVRAAILQNGYYTETDSPFAGGHDISERVDDLQRLFNTGFQSVFDAIQGGATNKNLLSAGFQVAAWEIIYETDPNNYNAGSGAFAISTTNVITQANTFLGNLTGPTTQRWDLTFLQKTNDQGEPTNTGQNLVTGTPAPIPLPAAGWLLLGGLAALGGLQRRRRDA